MDTNIKELIFKYLYKFEGNWDKVSLKIEHELYDTLSSAERNKAGMMIGEVFSDLLKDGVIEKVPYSQMTPKQKKMLISEKARIYRFKP